jgi:periplasmic protein TonB
MKKYLFFSFVLSLVFTFMVFNQYVFAQGGKEVFYKVDIMPEYPGGNEALIKSIVHEIKYPEQAKKENIQGKVLVEFVVDKQGVVTETKVLKGIGSGCNEEALRVVNLLKSFKPGMKDGKPVNTKLVIPIMFKLSDK